MILSKQLALTLMIKEVRESAKGQLSCGLYLYKN